MSDRVAAALAAICDTFVGEEQPKGNSQGDYWTRKASDLEVHSLILSLIKQVKAEDQANFKQLTDLISSPLLGLTWGGPLKPADRLTRAQRERMLHAWASSPLALLRNAYNTLRKATTLLYFGHTDASGSNNPNWRDIGYSIPDIQAGPAPAPLPLITVDRDMTLDCDVLVIGSGSGGGVVAATLAAKGQTVIVVEKGPGSQRTDFDGHEFRMMNRHYEAGALLATHDGAVTVMAGSTLGGGSSINWAGSLRTPDYVLDEWARVHYNPHFNDQTYTQHFEYVERRTGVQSDWPHNPQNAALMDAANALGWRSEKIPINMRTPDGMATDDAWAVAGTSCLGDAYGVKQGTHETFLRDAVAQGARIIAGVQIERINQQNGSVTGAEGICRVSEKGVFSIKIKAKRVVVSAGSLHTPVLLLKSGLRHPQIGRNLYLHPVVPVAAFYQNDTLPWRGPMMTTVVQEFARLDENWGFRLECPPVHPGLAASALSWSDSASFKADMLRIRQLAVHICLVRDRFGGRVTVGKKSGEPVLHYALNPYDRRHLIRAMQESIRAHAAADATEICILHNQPLRIHPSEGSIKAAQQQIARMKWSACHMGLYSAHQMGTCRMGGTRDYPVQPDGMTREVRNLYVADASLFPSASGANPMLSTQALARHVASGIS
jgi:choline dehydrogenase-like flavoprotein